MSVGLLQSRSPYPLLSVPILWIGFIARRGRLCLYLGRHISPAAGKTQSVCASYRCIEGLGTRRTRVAANWVSTLLVMETPICLPATATDEYDENGPSWEQFLRMDAEYTALQQRKLSPVWKRALTHIDVHRSW